MYWFEDDLWRLNRRATIDGINQLKTFLESKWFEPEIQFYINKKEIPSAYSSVSQKLDTVLIDDFTDRHLATIDFSNVDLVVMDYNLWDKEEETWDKIISYIRTDQNEIFTDILFYSQNKNETELRQIADRDGLYCSNWEDLFVADKIKKVIRTDRKSVV